AAYIDFPVAVRPFRTRRAQSQSPSFERHPPKHCTSPTCGLWLGACRFPNPVQSEPRRHRRGEARLRFRMTNVQAPAANPGDVTMKYQIAPLFCRPWTLLGITPRLIESHYENNYGGAFARLNAISEELEALDPVTTPAHVIRRLKQDEAAALNS